jgi:TonB family protein
VFTELLPPNRKRWDIALLVSFGVHVVAVLVLTHHSKPIFVMPSDVALGTPGSSGSIVYLAPVGPERKQVPVEKPKLQLVAIKKPAIVRPQSPRDTHENENGVETARLDSSAAGGSVYGSRVPGSPLTGHEIVPALPQVFPDPAVSRSDLPPGVQGDVVVEVTIDEQGNVVELKLIRGIGYGIEDRVLATLKKWHFRPASKDGSTIASQHIVTFHYPS